MSEYNLNEPLTDNDSFSKKYKKVIIISTILCIIISISVIIIILKITKKKNGESTTIPTPISHLSVTFSHPNIKFCFFTGIIH